MSWEGGECSGHPPLYSPRSPSSPKPRKLQRVSSCGERARRAQRCRGARGAASAGVGARAVSSVFSEWRGECPEPGTEVVGRGLGGCHTGGGD